MGCTHFPFLYTLLAVNKSISLNKNEYFVLSEMTKFASCNSFTISPGVYTETSITTKQNSYACIWSTLWKTDSEALQLNAWMWFQDTENNISHHIIMIMVMNVMLNAKLSQTWSLLLCMHAIIFVWFLLFPDFAFLFFNLKSGSCYINEAWWHQRQLVHVQPRTSV